MEENVGYQSNMEKCQQKKHGDAGSLKHFGYLCITGKAASVTRRKIPLHRWVGYPVGDKEEIASKDKQIFTQMDRVDRWMDKEALMLDIRGGKEGFMGKQLSYVTL